MNLPLFVACLVCFWLEVIGAPARANDVKSKALSMKLNDMARDLYLQVRILLRKMYIIFFS